MSITIHPTENKVMVEETQALRVDEIAVIFYEALRDFHTY